MFQSWKFIFLVTISMLMLAGCNQALEDRAADGIQAAEEAFYANKKDRTEEIDGIKSYKPAGFVVSDNSDAQNIVFKKNKETFILFVNPNEEKSSRLFYDLLLADEKKDIIAEETFSENDVFGFVAIIQNENEFVELIASVGGTKQKPNESDQFASINPRQVVWRSEGFEEDGR